MEEVVRYGYYVIYSYANFLADIFFLESLEKIEDVVITFSG